MSAVSAQSEMWVSMGLGMIKTGWLSEKRCLWTMHRQMDIERISHWKFGR